MQNFHCPVVVRFATEASVQLRHTASYKHYDACHILLILFLNIPYSMYLEQTANTIDVLHQQSEYAQHALNTRLQVISSHQLVNGPNLKSDNPARSSRSQACVTTSLQQICLPHDKRWSVMYNCLSHVQQLHWTLILSYTTRLPLYNTVVMHKATISNQN